MNTLLSPYRILDLSDEKGQFCGKMLSDLGAEVIKVEKPGGDPSRNIGPFFRNEVDPEKSLHWFAFNTNKKSITLNLDLHEGRKLFKDLVKTADIVIETFDPGYLAGIKLSYEDLEKINKKIILVSITPFGQTGPYKYYKAPEIVAWAMGAHAYQVGEPERPPLKMSHHSQSYLHASGQAAVAVMLALHHKNNTGEGQHIDVSIQESVLHSTDQQETTGRWDAIRQLRHRGMAWPRTGLKTTSRWTCKDGYVIFVFWFGLSAHYTTPLIELMKEQNECDDFLANFDFSKFDWADATQEIWDKLAEPTQKFFLKRTRAELYQYALTRRIQLFPIQNPSDYIDDEQLESRNFWVKLNHPELGESITYPGPFYKSNETAARINRRAPLIGEHNRHIYHDELGITLEDMQKLHIKSVI